MITKWYIEFLPNCSILQTLTYSFDPFYSVLVNKKPSCGKLAFWSEVTVELEQIQYLLLANTFKNGNRDQMHL